MCRTIIETERLILRQFINDDIVPAYEMNLDPEVTKYTHDGGVVDLEETRRRIEHDVMGDYQKYGFGRWAVVEKSSGKFIGFCGLKYLNDFTAVDLGYRLNRLFWGQGLATEAAEATVTYGFKKLALNEIIAFTIPENIASNKVLIKVGFELVGKNEIDGIQANHYKILKHGHE